MANDRGNKKKDRLLFLLQFLMQNTDDDHKISLKELSDLCAEAGYGNDRHAISSDINVLCSYGFDIITSKAGIRNQYNYGTRDFDLAELRTMIDAVASSAFISPAKTERLIQKIAGLTSRHEAEKLRAVAYSGKVSKSENNQIFLVVDMINQAIDADKKIAFQYFSYDGSRNRVMRHNGEVYTVSPYLTIWKGDRYYLVGWADNRSEVRTFRIDRMAMPVLKDAPAYPQPDGFDPYTYYCTLSKMYGDGPELDVILVCEDSLMNSVVDRFGTDFEFSRVDESHFRAKVHVNVSGTFLSWVFEYAGGMRIEGPEEAKQLYRERLKTALADT